MGTFFRLTLSVEDAEPGQRASVVEATNVFAA
jgi:hypothetical protein